MTKTTVTLAFQVFHGLLSGKQTKTISDETGFSAWTVKKARNLLIEAGYDLSARRTSTKDEAKHAKILELFETTDLSNSAIAKDVGITNKVVNRERRRFYATLIKRGSALPLCPCGLVMHHRYHCLARTGQRMREAGRRTIGALEPEEFKEFSGALLAGTSAVLLSQRYGIIQKGIEMYIVSMDPEDRAIRRDAQRVRRGKAIVQKLPQSGRPKSTHVSDDPTYGRIAALVGKGMPPDLQQDLISDAYLAVAMGEVKLAEVGAFLRKRRSKLWADHLNPYGTRSLDELDGFGRPLIERLAAEEAEDHMEDAYH